MAGNGSGNVRPLHTAATSATTYDVDSFMAALPEHDDYLRGLVWSVVRNRDVVDDLMQATYENAYRSLDRFDGRSTLRTWLHTICYRTAIDHIRYESRRPTVYLDAKATDTLIREASRTGEIDAGIDASSLLGRLTPQQRALLYYTAGLGYSYDEVAEITGLSRGTVASRVSRIKDKLRKDQAQ